MAQKSKAERIRELHAKGLNKAEISRRTGCRREYVRTTLLRQKHGGTTPYELKWRANNHKSPIQRKWARKRLAEAA